ncbi:hypothetical protein GYMLUDRAFT_44883 [Collybiopsis luxurians FD-317 M1]|uniref:DUF6534 domain-containing protein n=1 Tax=Collybiopsis luxurians FD-317 M1 TaxID=944289 RepID=A0A0D0CTP0_9AGAR|nr:hypothetical protein GYMLUDRAFT_44883 [Collybiopsis luxurians FD-317 M1]
MSSLNSTLGVLEIGILISGVLFGVVTCQVYIYHKNFPKDSLWLQIGLVDGMWLLELGHTICIFHALYFYSVTGNGNPRALAVAPKSLSIAVILHGVTIVLVQGYFTYRIYRFSQKPYIVPIISILLMFAQLLAVSTLCAEAVIVASKSLPLYLQKWEWLLLTTLWLRVAADLTISSSLVYFLIKQRNNAYKSTVVVVDRLIRWSIETGIITSMLGIILVIAYLTDKHNFAWLALFMVLPKVFSNTLLANMNSRASLRGIQTSVEVSGGSSGYSGPTPRSRTLATGLNVSVTTEMDTFDISQTNSWPQTDKYQAV